jgi:hypothetical protein
MRNFAADSKILNVSFFSRILVLSCVLLWTGCKKDRRILDTTVQPESDVLMAGAVTWPVHAHTKASPPVYSGNDNNKFIGSNLDPVFGKVDAGLYLNANTNKTNISFGTKPVLVYSEIVLVVDAKNYAGDSASVLSFSIFPVDSVLRTNRNYYGNQNNLHQAAHLPTVHKGLISEMKGPDLLNKKVLRIRFDSLYASGILNGTEHLENNTKFQAKYKGFYIAASVADNKEGVIFKCDMQDALSGLYLRYYENDTTQTEKEFKFDFTGTAAVKFNTFAYDYTGAQSVLKSQLSGDTTSGAQNLFVKGPGITDVRIQVPGLRDLSDSVALSVNRAEISFSVDESFVFTGRHVLPPALTLMPLDSAGNPYFARDMMTTIDNPRYNGKYDAAAKKYVFNLARHVQAVFNGEVRNHGFILMVANPERIDFINIGGNLIRTVRKDIYSEGAILHGSNSILKPVLSLNYTRLEKK